MSPEIRPEDSFRAGGDGPLQCVLVPQVGAEEQFTFRSLQYTLVLIEIL